ncbi:MAG: diguanylate cyclase [Anaerolineales bacterium]|nr:diguanylate cyclase [Chloroflexota bacterium]MBL6980802.1 diguanylate cyclase [Anaerolineales bacterium]
MLKQDHLHRLLDRLHESGISERELQELIRLRDQTAQALEKVEFDQDDQQITDDLLTLVDAVLSLSNLGDTKKLALLAAGYAAFFLGADDHSYWEWMPSAERFVSLTSSGIFGSELEPNEQDHAKFASVQPILESAFRHEKVVQALRGDIDLSDELESILQDVGVTAIIALPLVVDNIPTGVVLISDFQKAHSFQEYQMFLAQLLISNAGVVISRAQMYQAAERRADELELLRQASLTLTASLDLQVVLDTILKYALHLIHRAQDAHIFLYDKDQLSFKSALWSNGRKGKVWANPRKYGLTYNVARQGELIKVDNMRGHELYADAPKEWMGSIVGLPLKIGDRVVGVMTVAHPDENAFSEDEIRILQLLGDQASIAIENARLHDEVNRHAYTDALTSLPNRRALNERMQSELHRSRRYGRKFSLVMLDLDGFKVVNDNYGHPHGDEVLRKIARHMSSAIREVDYLARYGGDEFALLLPETDVDTAYQMAMRLQKEVAAFKVEFEKNIGIDMGISFGCATFPDHGNQVEKLYCVADKKLYSDKDVRNNGDSKTA